MAAPLTLSEIYDLLPISAVKWSIQRNDQIDGDGDGNLWQAELADPFWTGDVTLDKGEHGEMKQVAAAIRDLEGAKQSFLLCDPTSEYPQADPAGTILGASAVVIRAVHANRRIAMLGGLPAGYPLTRGDKMQITQGNLIRFHEISATMAANPAGQMDVRVFPRLSLSLGAGATVTLIRPACPVIIQPGSHEPGTARRDLTDGAAFRALQKRRT
ncbi:hypothetical protein [Shinella sp. G-2]|uniref:hypothetical protein n=1 Tax=Shinella sp. G-2 TaxID=3133141 RepID=UPI003D0926CE